VMTDVAEETFCFSPDVILLAEQIDSARDGVFHERSDAHTVVRAEVVTSVAAKT